MTKERAEKLMQAIQELKEIKKQITGWSIPVSSITIDDPLEYYLRGVAGREEIHHA